MTGCRRARAFTALALVLAALPLLLLKTALPAHAAIPADAELFGYITVLDDGTLIYNGDVEDTDVLDVTAPVVAVDVTPDGNGLFVLQADNDVAAFGESAEFFGSPANLPLNDVPLDIASTPTGRGYYVVAADGGVFAYGDAVFFGSMGGKPLNAPIVGIAVTPTGNGYWLVALDGGVFAFGDASFWGSMGGKPLNEPVIGILPAPNGDGYWLVATDGGVFNYGGAGFHGALGHLPLVAPVVSLQPGPGGVGYWMLALDGGVFAFDVPFFGSAAGAFDLEENIAVDFFLNFVLAEVEVPTALADSYTFRSGGTRMVPAPGVLGNDTGPGLSAEVVEGPEHGSVQLAPDGSFSYSPDNGYAGPDSFTYQAVNEGGESAVTTVSLTVNALPTVTSAWVDNRGTRADFDSGDVVHLAFSEAVDDAGGITYDGGDIVCGDNATCSFPTASTVLMTLTEGVDSEFGLDIEDSTFVAVLDGAGLSLASGDVTLDANPAPFVEEALARDNGTVGTVDEGDAFFLSISEDLAGGAAGTSASFQFGAATIQCGTAATCTETAPGELRLEITDEAPAGLTYPLTLTGTSAVVADPVVGSVLDTTAGDTIIEAEPRPTIGSITGVDHNGAGAVDARDTITVVFSEPIEAPEAGDALVVGGTALRCGTELTCTLDDEDGRTLHVVVVSTPSAISYPAAVTADGFTDLDYGSEAKAGVAPKTLTPVVTLRIANAEKDATTNPTPAVLAGDVWEFTFSEAVHNDIASDGSSFTVEDGEDATHTYTCGSDPGETTCSLSGNTLTVTIGASDVEPGLTYPVTVTSVSVHWKSADGTKSVDLSDSDTTIDATTPTT